MWHTIKEHFPPSIPWAPPSLSGEVSSAAVPFYFGQRIEVNGWKLVAFRRHLVNSDSKMPERHWNIGIGGH